MTCRFAKKIVFFAMKISFMAACLAAVSGWPATASQQLSLSKRQIAQIIRHGPWPPKAAGDRSNRVSGSKPAINLGRRLFFDRRLSRNGKISCSSCHAPELGWADGKARASGLAQLDRNTQSLFNTRDNRWFGLDGRNDSLWAHSIGPILDEREMGMTTAGVAATIRFDATLARLYWDAFGRAPDETMPEVVLVDVAKALAAFQETIVSGRTAFDKFRDALARGDLEAAKKYPKAARRGAKIFWGRGKCSLCHTGPRFTNEEFDDAGIPYFTRPGQVDPGRHGGIRKLKASRFNLLGQFNDSKARANAWATRHVAQTHRTFGQFRVPSLRQLTQTAPYMHNGSLASLKDVVLHYSNINLDRIHADGARILQPMNLSNRESDDLVAFLKTLSVSPQAAMRFRPGG